MIITVVIELVFYLIVKPLPLKEAGIDINNVLLGAFLFALFASILACFIDPWLIRYEKVTYSINNKRIRMGSYTGPRIYSWKSITGIQPIKDHEEVEDIICITLERKKGFRSLALIFDKEQEQLAKDVHSYIQQRISEQTIC